MSNHSACRVVWLGMTGLAIANLAGIHAAGAASIMFGGAAVLYASLRKNANTPCIQRLSAFLALLLLGAIAGIESLAWIQLFVAASLYVNGYVNDPDRKWRTTNARAVKRSVTGNVAATWT